jgi:hypothetical protein
MSSLASQLAGLSVSSKPSPTPAKPAAPPTSRPAQTEPQGEMIEIPVVYADGGYKYVSLASDGKVSAGDVVRAVKEQMPYLPQEVEVKVVPATDLTIEQVRKLIKEPPVVVITPTKSARTMREHTSELLVANEKLTRRVTELTSQRDVARREAPSTTTTTTSDTQPTLHAVIDALQTQLEANQALLNLQIQSSLQVQTKYEQLIDEHKNLTATFQNLAIRVLLNYCCTKIDAGEINGLSDDANHILGQSTVRRTGNTVAHVSDKASIAHAVLAKDEGMERDALVEIFQASFGEPPKVVFSSHEAFGAVRVSSRNARNK